jgi:hypothetical protein
MTWLGAPTRLGFILARLTQGARNCRQDEQGTRAESAASGQSESVEVISRLDVLRTAAPTHCADQKSQALAFARAR